MSYDLFLKRMQQDLQEEFQDFEKTLDQPFLQAARINPKKGDTQQLIEEYHLDNPSPFNPQAFIIDRSLGLSPAHIQGRIYLQEPSASSVVESMNIRPDDLVLDLCAAPGSKSTQIVSKLDQGFLVSNELSSSRAQALLSNLERMGAQNFLLLNQPAQKVSQAFEGVFNKVLVDAPCSGEGMLKKHDAVSEQWSQEYVEVCAARQRDILDHAADALAPMGELTYSTCTFSKEENEENVAWLLKEHPELEQISVVIPNSRPGFPTEGMDETKVARIFPMDGGEGHFIARFRKKEGEPGSLKLEKSDQEKMVSDFLKEQLENPFPYLKAIPKKDRISYFGMNHPFVSSSLPALRQGVYLGDVIKKRFEPAHAFFMSEQRSKGSKMNAEVSLDQMNAFMHGEQIMMAAPKGYVALTYEGIPFGFGKSDGKRVTNKIPKGLRLQAGSSLLNPEIL